jgi:hypothetical protein
MAAHEVAFYLASGGQDGASQAARLPSNQFARGVNIAISKTVPGTRPRIRVIPLSGPGAEAYATENVQGATFFNPAQGQGAVAAGRDESMLLCSSGGKKLVFRFTGRGTQTKAAIEEVGNGYVSSPDVHLAYWSQWENYALCGDGNGNTWIWDGFNPAFTSTGYNNVDKEASRVPNGGTVMVYAHGRGSILVNSRALLTGDRLNSRNLSGTDDVLAYREQVYFATGQFFSPPTDLGAVTAAAPLPQRNTQHGHGDVMIHCERGIFSVDLNIYPRSKWSETPMVKEAYRGSGATGPYAVAGFDGDQLFRSTVGVQTLRSAAAESNLIGNPQQPLEEPVKDFLDGDAKRWLRFASVIGWETGRRAFVTCYPIVQGRYRWHRGFVVYNFDPTPVKQTEPAWEGLWTLPPQVKGIIQFLHGIWDGEERVFALCRGDDRRNRLVEFRWDLENDILEDGSESRVRSQLITRKMDMTAPGDSSTFTDKEVQFGTLFFQGVRGLVDYGVWFRQYGKTKWTFWQSGSIDNREVCGDLSPEPAPWEGAVPLGAPPKGITSRQTQILVRWAGACSVEALRVSFTKDERSEDAFDSKKLRVAIRACEREALNYDDYEYADEPESESWLKETKAA